jgi:Transposase, Mutator family
MKIVTVNVHGLELSVCDLDPSGWASSSRRVRVELHERIEAVKRRSLHDVNLVVVFLDAVYLRVRPTPNQGVICARGITEGGARALVFGPVGDARGQGGLARARPRPHHTWTRSTRIVVADYALGLITAAEDIWPSADRQRRAVRATSRRRCRSPNTNGEASLASAIGST